MKKILFATAMVLCGAGALSADTVPFSDPPTLMISAECQTDAHLTLASVDDTTMAPQTNAETVVPQTGENANIAQAAPTAPPVHDTPGLVIAEIETGLAPVTLASWSNTGDSPAFDVGGKATAPVTLVSWPDGWSLQALGVEGTALAPMSVAGMKKVLFDLPGIAPETTAVTYPIPVPGSPPVGITIIV